MPRYNFVNLINTMVEAGAYVLEGPPPADHFLGVRQEEGEVGRAQVHMILILPGENKSKSLPAQIL